MPKSHRDRSRLLTPDLATYLRDQSDVDRNFPPTNKASHRRAHKAKKLLYTSTATLDTSVSTPFYPTFNARIVAVACSVATAPTSTMTIDVLLNGSTMFADSSDSKPTIPASQNWGYQQVPTIQRWSADNQDYVQVQITTVGGAGGPLVVTFYYREGLGGNI